MRVLVCGGREYADSERVYTTLSAIHVITPITVIIHGGAKGADLLAEEWADGDQVVTHVFSANWAAFGRSAGPIRNSHMLEYGQPDLVVAFPGGRGTADMVFKAKAAGVEVMELTE